VLTSLCKDIQTLTREKGYALQDILPLLYENISSLEMPVVTKVIIYEVLANLEYVTVVRYLPYLETETWCNSSYVFAYLCFELQLQIILKMPPRMNLSQGCNERFQTGALVGAIKLGIELAAKMEVSLVPAR
jgi:hypothetical protein